MSLKAVAFDFGGVIEIGTGRSFIDTAAEILGVPVQDVQEVYFQYNYLSNTENLPWIDMFMTVVGKFDPREETKEEIRAAIRDRLSQNKLNAELVALFPVLREQGLKVGILSNATSGLREKLEKHSLLDSVDEVVISGEIGFQKPHKEAFEVLFNRLDVLPHEAVFVDDSTRSLEKADEIGYIPILFESNEQLKERLTSLGLAVE